MLVILLHYDIDMKCIVQHVNWQVFGLSPGYVHKEGMVNLDGKRTLCSTLSSQQICSMQFGGTFTIGVPLWFSHSS